MWIDYNKYEELAKKGITLDMCYILSLYETDIPKNWIGGKMGQILLSLIRKGWIKDGLLTEEGKKILSFINGEDTKIELKQPVIPEDPFTRWWKVYPSTDTFEYKGQKFSGTRSLKVGGDKRKEEQKTKLMKVLNEKEYTIDQLIAALEFEIKQKKEESIRRGENKMAYFRNSLTYINQRSWEPFIELINSNVKITESKHINEFGI